MMRQRWGDTAAEEQGHLFWVLLALMGEGCTHHCLSHLFWCQRKKRKKSSWLWNQLCLSTAAAEELVSLYHQQQQVLSFSNSHSLSVFCCPASVSVCYPKIAESSAKDSFLSFWSSTEAAEMVAAAAFWAFCSSTSKILFFLFTHSLTCILFARSPGALFL